MFKTGNNNDKYSRIGTVFYILYNNTPIKHVDILIIFE